MRYLSNALVKTAPLFFLYFDMYKDIVLIVALVLVLGGLTPLFEFYQNFSSVVSVLLTLVKLLLDNK